MIIEYSYSEYDLIKKCYNCDHLKLDSSRLYGNCMCDKNKIKNRFRCVTDKACSFKRFTRSQ